MNKKIGVFDSGRGGLTILEKLKEIMPNEEYLYYADTKNNPYGEKSAEELLQITKEIVAYLISNDCKIIVIACNTATTKCLKKLRELYKDTLFIGTVPAIKMSSDGNFRKTLVMATPATIDSERTSELIRDFKRENQEIILLPCHGLAATIEKGNITEINNLLENILNKYKDIGIDSIVLGCTHYPLVKDNIKSIIDNATILDGSLGVAKETKRVLEKNNLLNDTELKINYIDSTNLVK